MIPSTARIKWEIEEYICQNWNQYIGCSVAKPTFAHRRTALMVNATYAIDVDEFDVIATMHYMVEMGNLVSCGWFGNIETFSVAKNVRE
jgi:hypothetical protein